MTGKPVIALLVISDGREDYLDQTMRSIEEMLPPFDAFVHVDDSTHELGFAGAVQDGWRRALATGADFVAHVEQDFTFNRPVPLAEMAAVLAAHPHLAQLALRRQPWNAPEYAAGGVVETDPDAYVEREWNGHRWLEHRVFYTTNPALVPRWVLERGWPSGRRSEGRFSIDLFASDPAIRAGYWGARDSGEACHHLGQERAGHGY